MRGDRVTPDLLLQAYASGVFPMADGREDDELYWVDPDQRGILPLNALRISRSLKKTVRTDRFQVTFNTCFDQIVEACAAPAPDRPSTWINHDIQSLYGALHTLGHAHSVECWQDGKLAGGLYGVHLRGAFFGESMFHRVRDASKVALVHLAARLIAGGFTLLDTQFVTPHLMSLGAVEIPRGEYHARLRDALSTNGDLQAIGSEVDGTTALQRITQIS